MSSDPVASLETSLQETADTYLRTSSENFEASLEELIADPAVGVPLPFEEVSLASVGVETDPTPEEIRTAATGVTPAGLGIASSGTLTVRSRPAGDELVSLYPRKHIAVVAASDVVSTVSAAFDRIAEDLDAGDPTQILTTGPSATGDLGGLIHGVHGPEQVDVVVLEDR